MAHIAKYKASAVGKLCAHYNRWQGIDNPNVSRENIDKSRTHLNYTLGVYEKDGKRFIGKVRGSASWATVKGRIGAVNARAKAEGKRATRKDAVVMADMVVTLPPNVPPEDAYKFFWNSYQHIADRVGRGNLMGGYVHMDETTPHMHVPFTPILDGRFNYKKMCDRKFYQTFHKGLGDRLEQKMGYRPEVELSEETRAQRVYTSRTKDIDKVRGAVDRAIVEPAQQEADRIVAAAREEAAALLNDAEARKAELVTEIADKEGDLAELDSQLEDVKLDIEDEQDRLECLRQRAEAEAAEVAGLDRAIAEAELQPAQQTLGESARTLFKARGDADREGSLGSEIEGLRSRIGELERANHGARERVAELDRKLPGLRDRCERARARFEGVELRVREAVGRLREVPNTLSEWALGIANRLGKRMYDPNSLDHLMRREQPRQQSLNDVLRDAQRAADAWNRDHAAPQRTYRGRAR